MCEFFPYTGYFSAISGYLRLSPAISGYLRLSPAIVVEIHAFLVPAISRLSPGYLRLSPAISGYLRLSPAISRLSPGYLPAISRLSPGYLPAISRLSPSYLLAVFLLSVVFLFLQGLDLGSLQVFFCSHPRWQILGTQWYHRMSFILRSA